MPGLLIVSTFGLRRDLLQPADAGVGVKPRVTSGNPGKTSKKILEPINMGEG
jgi:hypothetical protein